MKLVLVPRTQLSARLAARSTLKAKAIPQLPGAVLGTSPIVVTAAGLTYTVSLNLAALAASLAAILPLTFEIAMVFDGGGVALTTGVKLDVPMTVGFTISGWTLVADQVGSIVIDVWKDTYGNYPPTVADTITAAAKPTLAAAIKNTDATLAGWTKTVAAGETLRFNIDSAATVQRATLILSCTRT